MHIDRLILAHIRWFTETGEYPGEHFFFDLTSLLVITGAIMFVALAFTVDRIRWFPKIHAALEKASHLFPAGTEWRVVASLFGVLLIVNSLSGVFMAPDIALTSEGLVAFGEIAQMVIGLLLVSQLSFAASGLLILVVAIPLGIIASPIGFMIDSFFEFASLALALLIVGINSGNLDLVGVRMIKRGTHHFSHLPIPIMRIGVGLTLMALAIHNKLIDPNLGLTFLNEYRFNFMSYLGFASFTNLHFVLAAGVAELTLGLLLVFGIATRFVAAGLSTFLLATMFLLGPTELIGHLPIFGIALLLVIRGSGSYRLVLTVERVQALAPWARKKAPELAPVRG